MDTRTELISRANKAMTYAYAPYSHYHVGAAVLCDDGSIFTGCNIENASYGGTCCAERTAVFKAVSEGHKHIKAVAVCGGPDGVIYTPAYPCGICRQVLSEFGEPDMPVYVGTDSDIEEYTLSDLLPKAFEL